MHKHFNYFVLFMLCISTAIGNNRYMPSRNPFLAAKNNKPITHKSLAIHTTWIPIYFAKAKQISAFIHQSPFPFLSSQGHVTADTQNNQLFVIDDAKHIANIRQLIHHLDRSGPQFLIRAKIINIDREYKKSLGFLFKNNHASQYDTSPLTMDSPKGNTDSGQFTINLAQLANNNLLNLQLSALEQAGHATLISSPALLTLNNKSAVIQSGAQVPYQESTSSGATNVSFKNAVLKLEVTPKSLANNHVLLHISLNQDKVSELTINGVPAIQTQQLSTQVILKNKQTIVLGGILESSKAKQSTGIPVISDIPLIGRALRHHKNNTDQQELLIFLTPTILKA